MFFEAPDFDARIFAVDRFPGGSRSVRVKERAFSALALRLSGEAKLYFDDGTTLTSHKGDILYLPHGLSYQADYTDVEVLGIHFWDGSQGGAAENFIPHSPEAERLFYRSLELWSEGTLDARMEATACFYRILALLFREQSHKRVDSAPFLHAVSILQEEYTNPELNLCELCARAGISVSAFRRKCSEKYGKPPIKLLTELRLSHAQKLLMEGNARVEEIAERCGFYDSKYFSRVIKTHLGCTPRELRSV